MNRKTLGKIGEDFAAAMLTEEGYRILARNFRCRLGEIDIIAEKDGEISFIEVKTRRSLRCGLPSEAVTGEKQLRMKRAAEYYLMTCGGHDKAVQFQVIEIFCSRISHAFC